MTLAEFVEKYKRRGDSVTSIAEAVERTSISDDDDFVAAAKDLLRAEDKFYCMMLERGLEQ